MTPSIPPEEFAEQLRKLSKEEISKINRQQLERNEVIWNNFSNSFKNGLCSICHKPLKTFSAGSPCLHWLLRPNGFNKKHFPLIYKKFRYFRIEAFVRWVASIESPMKNINDIQEEHQGNKLFDFTAKYQHITWSFSCSESDFKGHQHSIAGNMPHYHFQMQLNGKSFIDYSDFHVPFHDDDLYDIELLTKHTDIAKQGHGRGAGMNTFLSSNDGLEYVINNSMPTINPEEAAYKLDTIVMAPEGKTISGEILHQVLEESKASGKTIASVIRNKLQDANIITIVSPGEGVPEAKPRAKKGRNKS